jgi:hypothetical protein
MGLYGLENVNPKGLIYCELIQSTPKTFSRLVPRNMEKDFLRVTYFSDSP